MVVFSGCQLYQLSVVQYNSCFAGRCTGDICNDRHATPDPLSQLYVAARQMLFSDGWDFLTN